jgi:Arc/MetJ family transcription regulator
MRITIDVDDELLAEAMRLMSVRSKKKAVETALREATARRRAAKAALSLRGKVQWDGDLDAMRRGDAPVEWPQDSGDRK